MLGTIALCFGGFLMLLSIFLKSVVIKVAIIVCMIGVIVEPLFKDSYLQLAAAFVAIFETLSAFFRIDERMRG